MSRTRLIRPADAPVLTELLRANRTFLAPWEPDRDEAYFTEAGQRAVIESALADHQRGAGLPWVILDDAGELAGRVTLNHVVRGPFQSATVGYWLGEQHTGHGLASSAVSEIKQAAFEELRLHRLEAGTLRHNFRSQHVLTRNGFLQYGVAPAYLRIAGRWQDHVLFQVLNPDWAP